MTTMNRTPESEADPWSDVDVMWASAGEITNGVRAGHLTVARVAEVMIDRIQAVNPAINAIAHFDADRIRRDAQALDDKQATGVELGALFGVPYTIKELTPVAGVPHTLGGFAMLKDNIAQEDALLVQRMRAADGLYLGQTNSPEAGYCGVTTNRLFGATRNPWNTELTAGGSSGGAAASVASGIGPIAEGTDAGGSIRVPAALNGVVGFKPTTGTIPHTLLPQRFLTNISHGVIGRSVEDVARMLEVCSGYDPRDPLARHTDVSALSPTEGGDLAGWRVAYSPDLGFANVDAEVAAICRDAVTAFSDLVLQSHLR